MLIDDYTVFERPRAEYPAWSLYTTCFVSERGYFHEDYQMLDAEAKAAQLLNLFAAMDILAGPEYFTRTFSYNPGI